MYCEMCSMNKAESGCYMPGADNRVCMDCFVKTVGFFPLPSNAPPSLGGTIADIKVLKQSAKDTINETKEQIMDKVSKTISGEGGGLQEDLGDFRKGFREKRESFWKQMPDEAQEYRNKFNKKKDEAISDGKEAAHGAVDWAKQKADSVFDDINSLF